MSYPRNSFARGLLVALVTYFCTASASRAYVDLAPTLAKVITDSKKIAVVEVVNLDRSSGELVLKEVRALKGDASGQTIRQKLMAAGGATIPRPILQWAAGGAQGVLFASRATSLVCFGRGWYQMKSSGDGDWTVGADRPDLPLAYYGSASTLAADIEQMLAGKSVVITTVAYGADNEGASLDLALNRPNLPGLVRLQRIRASMRMPSLLFETSSKSAYFIGAGVVDEADVPSLIEKLKSVDVNAQTDAADGLRSLGRKARSAEAALARLLTSSDPRVRLSAAAAVLRINPLNPESIDVLARGLRDANPAVRREAIRYTGLAGAAAAPLVEQLAGFLNDSDESVRITSLQAITVLGPVAAKAVDAVTLLLDERNFAIDAADALGRIGPAAGPALKKLSLLLKSDQPAVQWAAVRAMSQIGGPDAHPAVDYMVAALKSANETEGYHMMVYLALLGPAAADAAPAVRSAAIKNPFLRNAALWAMEPQKNLPWQGVGAGFGPMANGGIFADLVALFYRDYFREMGDRLHPVGCLLARKIMDGSAGEVPTWGYDLLACGGDEAAAILAAHLADTDIKVRERATVALGYAGPAAAVAKGQLRSALNNAQTSGEKRLIEWSLWKIDPE